MNESRETSLVMPKTMGLFALTIYGVGDMLGAGIYALIGQAAGKMGNAVWLAFVASMVAALLTGLSYAALGSRYPKAAGAAYITHRAFGFRMLAYTLGLMVMASGLTSLAAGANAFSEQLYRQIFGAPEGLAAVGWLGRVRFWPIILGYIGVLTFINFWGMRESTWMNAVCTFVEVGGLLVVIAVGAAYWGSVNYLETPVDHATGERIPLTLPLVLSGGVLTFYAFVGFEDMLNVSEEVKDVERVFPRALMLAVGITTVIYLAVAITAVSVLPHEELGRGASLVDVVAKAAPWFPRWIFAAVSLFAIANTGLLNYIMGSRIVYGMARQGLLPRFLGRLHATRKTPHVAILLGMVIVTALSLSGGIADLAAATSLLLLVVFGTVNIALIVLKRRPGEPKGRFDVPWVVPALGTVVCAGLVAQRMWEAFTGVAAPGKSPPWLSPVLALGLVVVIVGVYFVVRPKEVVGDEEGKG
jgi:amino acid transporter